MPTTYPKTFKILVAIIFLLPIFFIPGGILSLAVAKTIVLSIGVVVASISFLWETKKLGHLDILWHPVILVIALLPLIYFLSALLSTPVSLSLFGYNLEVGTFGFMLLVSLLLFITSVVVSDTLDVLKAVMALLASLAIVTLFALIKILSGFPVWGIFSSNTGNPIGNWTDLATVLGLLSSLVVLAIGMLPMTKYLRIVSYIVFVVSICLLVLLSFSSAFVFTLGSSILLFLYFSKMEKTPQNNNLEVQLPSSKLKLVILPIILGVVSLLFIINPTISTDRNLAEVLSGKFGINNSDIKPSLSATLTISKAVLSRGTLLGSGPNTFNRDWLIHKPTEVNATPFWSTNFSFGSGFIPTQIASTGILGTILWFALLALLLWLGVRAFSNLPEPRGPRFALVSTFLAVLYLWTAGFLYSPSFSVLAMTFVFTGLFISASRGIISVRSFVFNRDSATKLVSNFFLAVALVGVLVVGYQASKRTLSIYYYQKALALSNTEGVSLDSVNNALSSAIKYSPADIYYSTLSKLYFTQAQQIAQSTEGKPEDIQKAFQGAIGASIQSARMAVNVNPTGYENWITLGSVYSSLVPPPLSVASAYENANIAYREALNMNPSSPEIALLLAQLEVNNENLDGARNYIRQAIFLKEDYADAYVLLARVEVQDKNLPGAIASTQRLASLDPNNPGIYFELGLLLSSNNDFENAMLSFSKAIELLPGYANAKYYLGLTLEKLGRKDEARKQFEELLVTNPDSVEIKEALIRLNKK